ncbi:BsuBI/PstI family type II restriction endonuclease [Sphingorhabdus sp. YGSMI21]|uniref:BsuBI/PstI family type II restriction endonuclease n=1 Tax=Sphingorhabdus sp. YGSMI21 TaxID=2077182 RepID=UPI000C1EC30D|nr:BsuBI/PstI family type II restriction endonuclease [Sphingorhabdus sp. YGSMI21]ATW04481.1 restriction endonuclease [Sphingorhabdus sp. YGSMI21]
MSHPNIKSALKILEMLDFPKAQLNTRSALTLLALANVGPKDHFSDSENPLLGITPIMDWIRHNYDVFYAPNSRETFRRKTVHQFRDAGLVLYNPDEPTRAVNSPKAVYQLAPYALELLRKFDSSAFSDALSGYLNIRGGLAEQYAQARNMHRIPVEIAEGTVLSLSAGIHSQLIKDIIVSFAPHFAPGSRLVYAGDTGEKMGYFDSERLASLGVTVDEHGKMPDVVLHFESKNWLILAEAVTSHGPVDGKRHAELMELFDCSSAGLVYVTAFPSRSVMGRYLSEIAWETEVWVADSPTHLIHFNGERFLGPYVD